jgi:hypothetical protein
MSAPKTNVDRQVSRHRGPLLGMLAVGGFVAVLFLGWLFYETRNATDATEVPPPETADTVAPAPDTAPEPQSVPPAPADDPQPPAQP